jgi:hypothetical protein
LTISESAAGAASGPAYAGLPEDRLRLLIERRNATMARQAARARETSRVSLSLPCDYMEMAMDEMVVRGIRHERGTHKGMSALMQSLLEESLERRLGAAERGVADQLAAVLERIRAGELVDGRTERVGA